MHGTGPRRVLIAGGGVAGLETLLALRHLAEERVRIELLAPQRDFTYRPLSVIEPFGRGRAHRFDLAALVEERGARFRPDALTAVDPNAHRVLTRAGVELSYDALVVACGAPAREALPGALTFWGLPDGDAFRELLREHEAGDPAEIVFALPAASGWPLPLYELALLTRLHLSSRGADHVGVTIATHESDPLELFGSRASEMTAALLTERGIGLCTSCHPVAVTEGGLALDPAGQLKADRVVSVPRLEGRPIPGLPSDDGGFIPTDRHGLVEDVEDVYAAGDGTSFPVKQGGLAAQQADAVAEELAARAGAPLEPQPFRPILRGLLLTGGEPAFLRAELGEGAARPPAVASHALWWPPGKIAGKYLASHLAAIAKTELEPPPALESSSVAVDVALSEEAPSLH